MIEVIGKSGILGIGECKCRVIRKTGMQLIGNTNNLINRKSGILEIREYIWTKI